MGKRERLKKQQRIKNKTEAEKEVQKRKKDRKKKIAKKILVWILLPASIIVFVIGMWMVAHKKPKIEVKNPIAIMATDFGDIRLELYKDKAPKTVENFIGLSEKGYYNGRIFHRVIKDFMIQAGDSNCDWDDPNIPPAGICGTGGESLWGEPFEDEINDVKIDRGILAMANSGPNTNGSQFFIVTEKPQPQLDGKHTAFGKVIEGMEVVQKIATAETVSGDRPKENVKIKEVRVEE